MAIKPDVCFCFYILMRAQSTGHIMVKKWHLSFFDLVFNILFFHVQPHLCLVFGRLISCILSRAYTVVKEMSFITLILLYHIISYGLIINIPFFLLEIEFVEPSSAVASPTDGEALFITHYINVCFKFYPMLGVYFNNHFYHIV